jgi:hypothetical protein
MEGFSLRKIFSHHPFFPLFPQTLRRERAHLCNVDGHLLPPPPFLSRVGPSVQRGPSLLSNPPPRRERARLCNMGRDLLTKRIPSRPAPRHDPPVPRVPRLAPRLTSRDPPAPCVPRFAFPPASRDVHFPPAHPT